MPPWLPNQEQQKYELGMIQILHPSGKAVDFPIRPQLIPKYSSVLYHNIEQLFGNVRQKKWLFTHVLSHIFWRPYQTISITLRLHQMFYRNNPHSSQVSNNTRLWIVLLGKQSKFKRYSLAQNSPVNLKTRPKLFVSITHRFLVLHPSVKNQTSDYAICCFLSMFVQSKFYLCLSNQRFNKNNLCTHRFLKSAYTWIIPFPNPKPSNDKLV